MKNLKSIAAGTVIAGALGLAALGIGSGVANAAPPSPAGQWAQDRGWGGPQYGPGHDHWGGPRYGPAWAPPPPPYYGYGGYGGYGAPCATGPLGFVRVCA